MCVLNVYCIIYNSNLFLPIQIDSWDIWNTCRRERCTNNGKDSKQIRQVYFFFNDFMDCWKIEINKKGNQIFQVVPKNKNFSLFPKYNHILYLISFSFLTKWPPFLPTNDETNETKDRKCRSHNDWCCCPRNACDSNGGSEPT